jgi:hypothetical protein
VKHSLRSIWIFTTVGWGKTLPGTWQDWNIASLSLEKYRVAKFCFRQAFNNFTYGVVQNALDTRCLTTERPSQVTSAALCIHALTTQSAQQLGYGWRVKESTFCSTPVRKDFLSSPRHQIAYTYHGIYMKGLKKLTNNCMRMTDDSAGIRISHVTYISRKRNRYTNSFGELSVKCLCSFFYLSVTSSLRYKHSSQTMQQ